MIPKRLRAAVVLAALVSAIVCAPVAGSADEPTLDATAVFALLDLLDTLMAKHSDYEVEASRIERLTPDERRAALDAKAAGNAADPEIGRLIDGLHATPAYVMYFLQFRYTSRDTHRRVLLALPYEAISSPAGISHTFKELCLHRDEVRAWVNDVVGRIDVDACRRGAMEWLPAGDYPTPVVRFIYDGNGDAFAQFGGVCFDLFSLIIRRRPVAGRFDDLDGVGVDKIEKVLAHEFHHVFAGPLRTRGPEPDDWRAREVQYVAQRIVSEGVAMRCDLGPGVRRDVMEDTVTVAFWIDQLNEKLAAMAAGAISEEDMQAWHSGSYGAPARERLRDFFARTRPGDDADALVARHAASRPSMVYTLGWWMISRILDQPDGRARVIDLLSEPGRVFAVYNEAMGAAPETLRIVAAP